LKIKYSLLAQKTLTEVALFIEKTNTKGSGNRWKNKFLKKVTKYVQPVTYALCRHKIYAENGFSCISIDSWIIIFKADDTKFNVHQIVLASSLY
jgi:hypothetical protein